MQKVSIKIICLMSFLFLSFNFVNPSFSISAVKLNFLTKHFQTADLAPQEAEIPEVQFDEFWPNEMDAAIDVSYQIHRQSEVLSWFGNISEAYMNGVITHLSSYHTRYYNTPEGVESLQWIGSEWERLASGRKDISVEYFKHKNFAQPSVILTVQGSDPVKKNQIIILGGHGDSINADDPEKNLAAPGADDNAAGIAVLSEILRNLVENKYHPKHTLQFIAYAAEEVGLQGSEEIARLYRQQQKRVIGVMQFDGVNYAGKSYDMTLIADGTHSAQDLFVARLVNQYLKVKWVWNKCEYACSDHYSWHAQGYRTSYPVESSIAEQNPYFHSSNDTFDKSNFSSSHASLFVKLGMAYFLEMDQ